MIHRCKAEAHRLFNGRAILRGGGLELAVHLLQEQTTQGVLSAARPEILRRACLVAQLQLEKAILKTALQRSEREVLRALAGEDDAVDVLLRPQREQALNGVERCGIRDVGSENLVMPPGEGDKRHVRPVGSDLAEEEALLPQLVEAAPLRTARIRKRRPPRVQHTGEGVRVPEGEVGKSRLADLRGRDGAVAAVGRAEVGMQHHQVRAPVVGAAHRRERAAVRLLRRSEGRAPDGAAQLRLVHADGAAGGEDVDVFRPRRRAPRAVCGVKIVVAGCDEHAPAEAPERVRQLLRRLAVEIVGVEEIPGQQHQLRAVVIRPLDEPRGNPAALPAAQTRLLLGERAEGTVEVEIRRVKNLYHVTAHSAMPCTHRPTRRSLRRSSARARHTSAQWRSRRCQRRETPSQSA